MSPFTDSLSLAFDLVAHADPALAGIVGLSLRVSAGAALVASVAGVALGAALAAARFPAAAPCCCC